jgi:hypothetical protein
VNEWLARGLISAAAGALSTVVIVKTAEGASPQRKKRKRRKKSAKRKEGSKAKDSERTGQSAADRIEGRKEEGLDFDTWWSNLKEQGKEWGTRLGATGKDDPRADDPITEEQDRKVASSGKDVKAGRTDEMRASQDGYVTLGEEAAYWAKTKIKEKVVDSVGLGDALSSAQEHRDRIKNKSEMMREKIAASDAGRWVSELQEKGKEAAQGIRDVGNAFQEEVSSAGSPDAEAWTEQATEKAQDLGVWLEGPGAVDYHGKAKGSSAAPVEAHFQTDDEGREEVKLEEEKKDGDDPAERINAVDEQEPPKDQSRS